MRIVHLLPNMAIGGRERMTAALAEQQLASGNDVGVVGYEPLARDDTALSTPFEYQQLDRKSANFGSDLARACSHADIIHAQGHVSAHILRHENISSVPRLATLHVGMECSWRWSLAIRRGLRVMDSLIAVTRPMANLYRLVSGRTVDVVPNGVDLEGFRTLHASAPDNNEPYRFAMLARLHDVKRHQDAIAAMDILSREGISCELWIAGDGPEMARLHALAKRDNSIHFLGPVADVESFLADKHGFIICSRHEGLPMALIEAMASGLPVIASAVGGLPNIMPSGSILFDAQNVKQLAAAMKEMASDRSGWPARSAAARAQAAKFDVTAMAAAYQALYDEIIMR